MAQLIADLERLARTDPAVAPLARLQAVALRAAEDPAWAEGIPDVEDGRVDQAAPLLEGVTLAVDGGLVRALLRRLAATLDERGNAEAGRLRALFASADLDPLELLRASLTQDDAALVAVARRAEVEPALLTVVAHTAALPLLAACGRRAAGALRPATWPHGYCPVCAAWPMLAEVRGLARDLILRCGRCGGGWQFEHRRCLFCGNREHRSQGYFAAERERETRRAVTCDRCRGYFKTQTTLGPLELAEVLTRDLETLELDVAALDHGYRRPDAPGRELSLRVEPAPERRGGWLRWRS
jgi:FdhE protein